MKNRLISLMLAALLVVSLFPLSATAADIVDSGTCGDNLTWTLDSDGLLTISGTGQMADFDWQGSPFYDNSAIRTVVIEPGVTSIGNNAFNNCDNLTSVRIPESVMSIGRCAFEECFALTSVIIPDSVTSIGDAIFRGCSSLTTVTIPEGVTNIGNSAFYDCISLASVKLPPSVTSIDWYAFSGCSSLTKVTIPEGVTSIGSYAFYDCSSLTSVTTPEGVETIGKNTFSGCSSLMSIVFPGTVTTIEKNAFDNCKSLTEVYFGGDASAWKQAVDTSNVPLLNAPYIHLNTTSPDGHFRPITVPATCETEGYTARTCDCGYEYDRVVTEPALGHDWTPWATLLEPTATTKGIAVRICANDPKHVEFKALPTAAEDSSNPFTDVAEGKFYHDPVLWAISQDPQITTGVTDTTFEPDRSCTRAHVVTFLWRANGCPEPANLTSHFKDVKDTSKYYYKAVLWASEQGITTGYSDGTFRPNDECTRGQVVTFLWRAKGQPAPTSTSNPFSDVPAGKYYTTAVLWALENDITTGRTATTFDPDGVCTRGHVVTFLYRAYA